jgi:hypothetical protein
MIQLFLQYTQKEGVEKLDGKSDNFEEGLKGSCKPRLQRVH